MNSPGQYQTTLVIQQQGLTSVTCNGFLMEINEDFDNIIYTLAREAASGENGMTVSPLINADRKGGAFPIMLQQFRRAIGISIIRGQAKLRLSRLHYMLERQLQRPRMYVNRTIVKRDGTHIIMATLVGSLSTVLKDTGLSNNSEMDMTFVFLRGTQKI